jgi:hypothetical protein
MKLPRIRTSAILSQHKQQSMRALHRRTTWKDEPRLLRNANLPFAGVNIQDAPGAATTLRSRRYACDHCRLARCSATRRTDYSFCVLIKAFGRRISLYLDIRRQTLHNAVILYSVWLPDLSDDAEIFQVSHSGVQAEKSNNIAHPALDFRRVWSVICPRFESCVA